MAGYFEAAGAPGPIGPTRDAVLRGLVAPHIDFKRGGAGYAWAYRALAETREADCYIVLGTAHGGLDGHAFAATAKAFETPFGPLEVDHEVLDAVVRRAPPDLFAEERGAVVEGSWTKDGYFKASLILAKHSEEYKAPHDASQAGYKELVKTLRGKESR